MVSYLQGKVREREGEETIFEEEGRHFFVMIVPKFCPEKKKVKKKDSEKSQK